MKISKFKKEIKKEGATIPYVYDEVKEYADKKRYSIETKKKEKFNFGKLCLSLSPMLSVIILILVLSFMLLPSEENYDDPIEKIAYSEDLGLYTVDSEENLRKILYQNAAREASLNSFNDKSFVDLFLSKIFYSNNKGYGDITVNDATNNFPFPGPETDEGDVLEENGETITNIQTQGLDEADIVKYDGDYVYLIMNSCFYVLKCENEITSIIYKESLSLDDVVVHGSNLYIHNDYVLIMSNYVQNRSTTTLVNIYNISTLTNTSITNKQARTYQIEGNLVDSRLKIDNDTLYLLTAVNIYETGNNFGINIKTPEIYHDGEKQDISFEDIKYCPETNNDQYVIISMINLSDVITFSEKVILGNLYNNYSSTNGNIVYSSNNALYLISNQYYYNEYIYKTCIMKFTYLEDGNISYRGFALLDGYVVNQYSLDEYDGYLRLATTNINNVNKLFVLKEDFIDDAYVLSKVGSIEENLGKPGEKIYSVRFDKDIAYVVTFRQTDPLYAIDLSTPTNPKITYSYETPGYSSYLHVIPGTKFAIGVGIVDRNYKVSIYLVEDENNKSLIGEIDQYLIPSFGYGEIDNVVSYQNTLIPDIDYNNTRAYFVCTKDNTFYFGFGAKAESYTTNAQDFKYYLFAFDIDELKNLESEAISKVENNTESAEISTLFPDLYNIKTYVLSINDPLLLKDWSSRLVHTSSSDYFYYITNSQVNSYIYDDITDSFILKNELEIN